MKDSLVLIYSIAVMAPSSATRRRNDGADARTMKCGKEINTQQLTLGKEGAAMTCRVPLWGNH